MRLPGLPRRPVVLPLASAALLALAFPPFHLILPSFLGLVPYAVWVARLPAGEEGRSDALRGGYLMGLVFFTLLLYWLVVSLIFYTPLAVLAFLLPVLILSGFLALVTLAIHQTVHRLGWPVWVALPVFWTAMEWLRAHLGDVSFPWMQLGDSLTGYPWLIGAADLVGSRGMSFWLAMTAGLLAEAVLRRRRSWPGWLERWTGGRAGAASSGDRDRPPPAWRALVATLLLIALPVGYSLYRWKTLRTIPAATAMVIQPNIPEDLKMDPWSAVDSTLSSSRTLLRRASGSTSPDSVDLVVFPEATFPVPLDSVPAIGYGGAPRLERWLGGVARGWNARVLFGGMGIRNLSPEEFLYFNSAFLLDSAGRRVARYDKRELVPVIERVPFVEPEWFQGVVADALGPYFGGNTPGGPQPPLAVGAGAVGPEFGVLICYESIFTELARQYRRDGADFLVNVTNDAWYGREEPRWSRTSALWQHPAHLVMRAIENRVGVVRSANTGISEIVDPLGRTSHRTELFEAAVFTAPVSTTPGGTFYAQWGDLTGWAAALAALVGAVASGLSRRRAGPTEEETRAVEEA